MTSADTGKQRGKKSRVAHLEALSTNRIVLEITAAGQRCVAVSLGHPPAAQNNTVTLEVLSAEINVLEIGPSEPLNFRIVTTVLSESVEKPDVPLTWRDVEQDRDCRKYERRKTLVTFAEEK